jgi:hypothetical protein
MQDRAKPPPGTRAISYSCPAHAHAQHGRMHFFPPDCRHVVLRLPHFGGAHASGVVLHHQGQDPHQRFFKKELWEDALSHKEP